MSTLQAIYTFGTSDCTEEDVGRLFRQHNITLFVDIRSKRGSRQPQWDQSRFGNVSAMMERLGVFYDPSLHEILGGLQKGLMTLGNFRAYTQTQPFKEGIERLKKLVIENDGNVVIACCERDWRACHRKFVAEALKCEGWEVQHL